MSLHLPLVLTCLAICTWTGIASPASAEARDRPPDSDGLTRNRLTVRRTATPVVLNDDGAWSWFEDERALMVGNKLIVGSVASGIDDPDRRGDIDVVTYDLDTGGLTRFELHDQLERDDHDSPALLVRSDGRLLAVYSKHGKEDRFYYRISEQPGDATAWGETREFVVGQGARVAYSNVHRVPREGDPLGRIYNFFRGLEDRHKPAYAYSDDDGETWVEGNVVIDVPGSFEHWPYVKYASRGDGPLHLLYTDSHPRFFDNSIYHVMVDGDRFRRSDGSEIRALASGLLDPLEGARVFLGDASHVAWAHDLHLDPQGNPFAAYAVKVDGAGVPVEESGFDHRYRYARWDGTGWVDHEIGFAGARLYALEQDYTGGIALDPADPNTVFVSTDVDPSTGVPLASGNHEIFRGRTDDGGVSWRWFAVTQNSEVDNLRPIVPRRPDGGFALLWLRGRYTFYWNYDLEVVGLVQRRR